MFPDHSLVEPRRGPLYDGGSVREVGVSDNTVHLINISMVFCFGRDAIDGPNSGWSSGWQPDQ